MKMHWIGQLSFTVRKNGLNYLLLWMDWDLPSIPVMNWVSLNWISLPSLIWRRLRLDPTLFFMSINWWWMDWTNWLKWILVKVVWTIHVSWPLGRILLIMVICNPSIWNHSPIFVLSPLDPIHSNPLNIFLHPQWTTCNPLPWDLLPWLISSSKNYKSRLVLVS